jgi:Family of unknown function (DUF6879)
MPVELLTSDDFRAVFRSSRRAFHLELKESYNVAREAEPFRKWRAGEPDSYEWRRDWLTFIREATEAGIVVQRVRIASVPPTDYLRWELALTPQNIEAGEDVRYLPRHLAQSVELPEDDCWLFDDDRLVLSIFTPDGRAGAFVRDTDGRKIAIYKRARRAIWPIAIPYSQYVH